ncbi:LPS-assembly protein LptD [Ahrensia marina]|uniref:LPS-assembly protein LptD n=1 Tax=Ahrensia marina TaxID=1514904 RepID=UPI0006B5EFC6|nr:LPS-assembly protein LptD [Ahrensia marina]
MLGLKVVDQRLINQGDKYLRSAWRRAAALSCASALAIAAATTNYSPALAQSSGQVGGFTNPSSNAQLLLQADELVYDNDNQTITARGGVRIDYDGTILVASRVIYQETDGRLIAVGDVEILQPDGTRTFADEIDITDDFRDGFVNSLRVVTTDETRFAAESATRQNGEVTTFNNGIYTACNECVSKEGRPLWQIKAKKIIWNGEEKTVRFERATFEFIGVPLASIPVFTTSDPSVKRKTGFLIPSFKNSEELGFGLRVPYFINIAPNKDLTLAVTGYTKQGFLGEAEYRHRLENGVFTLKTAGIHQFDPDAFGVNEIDSTVENRGMIGTTGRFTINPRWAFGWNGMLQSDADFSKTYEIAGFNSTVFENNIYLTGIGERSYFDARTIYYDYQSASVFSRTEEEQAVVLPSVDYNYTLENPVAGGELSFNVFSRYLKRDEQDSRFNGDPTRSNFATPGVDADTYSLTAETEWKRTFITDGGLMITPLVHAQGNFTNLDDGTSGALSATNANLGGDGSYTRGMVTAGLELRYPILFSTSSATHILEPVAQVFARPDENQAGVLPNEDAQSLVFDANSLFARDKFSGYDRIEGGTRANLGLRYTGTFDNGWGIKAIFGQSYHLAGTNSFAQADTFNTGQNSGLETTRSDYVGAVSFTNGSNYSFDVGARFDEDDFEVQRADLAANYTGDRIKWRVGYAFIGSQPAYNYITDRQEVSSAASYEFAPNWSVFGGVTYDVENTFLDKYTVGIGYDCDCFKMRASYTEDRSTNTDAITKEYQLFLSFRTLGDFGETSDEFASTRY